MKFRCRKENCLIELKSMIIQHHFYLILFFANQNKMGEEKELETTYRKLDLKNIRLTKKASPNREKKKKLDFCVY